jgi:hypothetical protein
MRLSRRPAGVVAAALIAVGTVTVAAPSASASIVCNGSASVNHSVNSAQTFVDCVIIKTYPSATPAAGSPTFVNWTPPVCWLEPQYTGTDLQALIQAAIAAAPDPATTAYLQAMDLYYKGLNNYHIGDSGMWWGVGCRTDDFTYASVFPAQQFADGLSANNPWVWIAAGAAPTQPNPVDGQILAEYAAAELTPPQLTFSVNPGALQTVNLSTRVYSTAPAGTYQDIEAQASIGGMTSTVDATPSSVTITPGGPASQTVGGPQVTSITCPISGGSFGSPYNDSCAFYYTQATPANTSYKLTASITWTYTWQQEPNAAGWPVAVTVGGAPVNVTVQEVQSIVVGQQ